jgi:16S rRNA (adenine1518-N6/adenine1519-N6)-dimethyltransferase
MKSLQHHTTSQSFTSNNHIAPRKDLGQNFLRDANIARNIVRALDIQPNDVIVEIGPGEGALTKLLMESSAANIVAVEYDQRAVEMLEEKFEKPTQQRGKPAFTLLAADIRKTALDTLPIDWIHPNTAENLAPEASAQRNPQARKTLKVIGNIPYYITSDILFWIFDEWARSLLAGKPAPERAIIMMQKEVAQRIVAKKRTKEYGILSIASLLVSEPKMLFQVSPQCFFPPPNVTSAVVEFRMKSRVEDAEAFKHTHGLVRAAFNQRRKMLSNALHTTLTNTCASRTDITPTAIITLAEERGLSYFRQRAEELTPQDFIALSSFLRSV